MAKERKKYDPMQSEHFQKWLKNREKSKKPMQIHYLKVEIIPDYNFLSNSGLSNAGKMLLEIHVNDEVENFSFEQVIDIDHFESTFSMLMDKAKHTIERLVKEYQEKGAET